MSLDQPKKFNSFDQDDLLNAERKQIEEFIVPHDQIFFHFQNNIHIYSENTEKKDETQKKMYSDFTDHFSTKQSKFLDTNTITFQNIIKYFEKIQKCPGITYCLANLPENIKTDKTHKYHQFVLDLRDKIKTIKPEDVFKFFVEYFIEKKNEYINTRDTYMDDKPIPLNYIDNTNPMYSSTPGTEVKIKVDEDKTKTVKVTNIVLHNLTNIIGHKAIFFSGYDYGLYQKGTEKYDDFLKNFSCTIIIIKMFFDKDDTGKTY